MTTCSLCGQRMPEQCNPGGEVRPEWTFTVPRKLLSANKHIVNSGPARWAYKADRDSWGNWMLWARNGRTGLAKAKGRRSVQITRLYSGREREWDPDNVNVKALLDAMVIAGMLVDDNTAYLDLKQPTQRRAESSGVEITIKEAQP